MSTCKELMIVNLVKNVSLLLIWTLLEKFTKMPLIHLIKMQTTYTKLDKSGMQELFLLIPLTQRSSYSKNYTLRMMQTLSSTSPVSQPTVGMEMV